MAKYLVTGAAGFICSHIVDALIDAGHEVVAMDDLSGGFVENVNKRALFINVSVTDPQKIEWVFEEFKPDYVIHGAAYAAEGLSHFIRNYNYQVNLIGSINLINSSVKHDIKCFVFLSSVAVYGHTDVMTEDQAAPIDPYGIAKYATELDLKAAHEQFGLNYVIFRLHNVYGERQNTGDMYRNVLGIFMAKKLQGESVNIFGDGEQTRSFTYIKDIVPVICSAVEDPRLHNDVFNLGSSKSYTINQLADVMGISVNQRNYVERRNEAQHANPRHEKIRTLITLLETPLSEGVAVMWKWVQENGLRKPTSFGKIEVKKNMPPVWI